MVKNRETALKQIAQPKFNIKTFDPALFNDREIMEQLIKKSHINIRHIGEGLKNDVGLFMLAHMLRNESYCQLGNILAYAGNELRSNKAVMKELIPYERYLYTYATGDLLSDRDFLKKLIADSISRRPNGQSIDFRMLPLSLLEDDEIVEGVIISNPVSFHYYKSDYEDPKLAKEVAAFNRIRSDKALMLRILRGTGFALQNASEEIKDSEEHVMAAVKSCPANIQYASSRLRDSEAFRDECLQFIPEDSKEFFLNYTVRKSSVA